MMNKYKNFVVILLLVIITASIITVPIIFNSLSGKSKLDKKSFWEYTPKNENKVTANNVIDFINSSYNTYTTPYDEIALEKDLADTLYSITDDDSYLQSYIKKLLINEVKCSQNDYWITVNGGPSTLSIVFAVIYTPDEFIEIVFESKTQTLISFTGDCLLNDTQGMKKLYDSILRYFQNDLKLEKNQYNFDMHENEERLFLNCGLSYNLNEIDEVTDNSNIYIQN